MTKVSLTVKQAEITEEYLKIKPRIIVLYGAVRSGKTVLAVFLFLLMLAANAGGGYHYIIGGVSYSSIRRNVLDVIEDMLDTTINLSKSSSFKLFGNTVHIFGGADKAAWKTVRGFTAKGALLNEATALHEKFIFEVLNRTSEAGSQIIMDTNPDNPTHVVNTQFIQKSGERLTSGRENVRSYHFNIYDNEFLDAEYIEGLIASTPSGMMTDRNIWGKWVAAEGAIYVDFSQKNWISEADLEGVRFERYMAGVDWGYAHKGVISVWGVDADGCYYRLAEHAERYKDIDYWVNIARQFQRKYRDITFYCDPARQEYLQKFRQAGLSVRPAYNSVMSGISILASLYKTGRARVNSREAACEHFKQEIYTYSYNDSGRDEPKKVNDDVMDADRYAVASDFTQHAEGMQTADDKLQMLSRYGLI